MSPISDLTERLLLEECDPPATPQESLYEAPPFDEVRFQTVFQLLLYFLLVRTQHFVDDLACDLLSIKCNI